MEINLAVIPGDGIGPEVTAEALETLRVIELKFGHKLRFTEADAGGIAYDKTGAPLPEETLRICRAADSVLLGAVGGPKWDGLSGDKRPEAALLGLRGELSLYANLRPAYLHEALRGACPLKPELTEGGVDIMVVRELTGGIYFGARGVSEDKLSAWDTEKYSVAEVERIARVAFEIAMKRGRRVCNVDKANVLESSRLWRRVVAEVAGNFPEVELSHMYVDNAAMQLVRNPRGFDVLVTTNMFGDILSDEAAQITGSIGMLPSASLGEGSFGMYEPIHGSAPDIAGRDLANPIATVLSAAMMLRYSFGLLEEAECIERAVKRTLSEKYRTADIYSEGTHKVGTREMGRLLRERLGDSNFTKR
ncbi:MAG: 3-isopropylmalate dehydrogenase [Clostridiales bacterium]|jgi:3-isopropylmalate dehydrogenase|nr:3-isopropylmalate dehydrogenase [Clostridiales bacterium]